MPAPRGLGSRPAAVAGPGSGFQPAPVMEVVTPGRAGGTGGQWPFRFKINAKEVGHVRYSRL
ncbi:hypothetical protein GCM10010245_84400 [Streptomyces spectabilis]|nr:hypothetical protein GCM10010245_84400 [Streptomyces spectabilis]